MINLKLNDTLRYFKRIINQATDRVWHYERPQNESFPWCVWTEYTEGNSLYANNSTKVQPVTILVDYFTQEEFDPTIDRIQNVLNMATGVSFDLTDINYDEETRAIHYSWNVEVINGENRGCRT